MSAAASAPRPRLAALGRRPLDALGSLMRRSPKAAAGIVILLVLSLMAISAPLWTSYDPTSLAFKSMLTPSRLHPLGTTFVGQDILSQLLYGARFTMLIGLLTGLIATLIGTAVGISAAYFGGRFDEIVNGIINVVLVLPGFPLLIVAAALLENAGDWAIIIVISLTGWAWGARVLRAQAMTLRRRDFIDAAVSTGEGPGRIIFREMLPNLSGIIAANFFGTALYGVLSESGLKFIGVGDVTQPSWGSMLYWAAGHTALLKGAWWWVMAPGLCIALLGTSFALLNFAIDEIANPKAANAGRLRAARRGKGRVLASQSAAQTLTRPNMKIQPPNPAALLSVRHLTAGYQTPQGPVRAVRNVSLDVMPGEFLGLAGESGCGKSTLAFAATRLLAEPGEVFSGQSVLEGVDLLTLSESELRRRRWKDYSMVFQASMNVLNPVLRVREQLYDAMQAHGVTDKAKLDARARELFGLVGIRESYLDVYPHQLSGGMKQRVVIAIALALEPKLVVLDEPTTALDVVVQRQILEEIQAVRRRLGIGIVMITHDLSLLTEMSDRIAIMYAGEIVEEAPSSVLQSAPLHPYTRRLMTAFPPLGGERTRREGIPGRPPSLALDLTGCPFAERCDSVMPICSLQKPVLSDLSPGHRVACFLHASPEQLTLAKPEVNHVLASD
ncbi:dipeptide/oligopeptide/nickel ABC transporter permease/ATP-binding protein [Deinococcus sp.]|uniref:dipeptide/oligopeptide/nickel ABC transporter permease/ATP-binding protein n=1 Tax=Deinococcus sp. TaxID=47478 RepID=UPI0025D9960B|nr:dipeptide/oligopeptide/nickel ABC transporter permease/ATP-binding protein [Deinococcus sp.]